MTKEIIIDGVNVAECCRFEIEQGKPNNTSHTCDLGGTCDGWENCYFKQLQRLKQENKTLQMLTCVNCGEQFLSPDGSELYEKNVQLQKENEQLKDENSHKSCLIWYIFNCSKVETIQRLLYEYYECINDDRYNKKRVKKFWDDVFHLRPRRKYKSKYKQALEEIKKWATNHNPCDIEADINCIKEDCFNCLNYDIREIIKIIDEVLGEN